MGVLIDPPPTIQVAQANDYLFAVLEAVRLAQATMISRNLKLTGTIAEQEAFALTWSEIRGIAARAIATNTDATAKVNQAVDERILDNPAYDKFKIATAGSDDPLMR